MPIKIFLLVLSLLFATSLSARTLEIGPGKQYATLQAAAADAQPGDTLQFTTGIHQGGGHIVDLHGTESQPIVIRGDNGKTAIVQGGSNGFQMSDARYVRLEGLVFEQQTGNGLNIDDGGSPETPSHHIIIDNCEWRSMSATGNNDELKMSGIDDFSVVNCTFLNGAAGGSMIDMVGCHRGRFWNNTFQNAGSNCIQAKGGTSEITIQRNHFLNGGQRAVNIGGSTGLVFFRPLGADYEAKNISVYSNLFNGGVAAVAFVGAIDSRVINNTIIRPERWAIRILQESVDGFQPSGNNSFINNIVVFNSTQPAINIGPNTAPETFTFSNNLWYNPDDANWSGPNTPVNEPDRILQRDPNFVSAGYHIDGSSPAFRAGLPVVDPDHDLYGVRFANPPSIGAVELPEANVNRITAASTLQVYPNPATHEIFVDGTLAPQPTRIVDVLGREHWRGMPTEERSINVSGLAPGSYLLLNGSAYTTFVKR